MMIMAIRRALRGAFEDTYGRAITVGDGDIVLNNVTDNTAVILEPAKTHYYRSITYGIIGLPIKYKRIQNSKQFIVFLDRNLYNLFEQIVFSVPRIIKNILKLATEFVPFALGNLFMNALITCIKELPTQFNSFSQAPSVLPKAGAGIKIVGTGLAVILFELLWLASRTVALLGQSILSPLSAMKLTARFFSQADLFGRKEPRKLSTIALFAVFMYFSLIIGAYAVLAIYLLPILVPVIAHGAFFSALAKTALALLDFPLLTALGLFLVKVAGLRLYGRNKSCGTDKLISPSRLSPAVISENLEIKNVNAAQGELATKIHNNIKFHDDINPASVSNTGIFAAPQVPVTNTGVGNNSNEEDDDSENRKNPLSYKNLD